MFCLLAPSFSSFPEIAFVEYKNLPVAFFFSPQDEFSVVRMKNSSVRHNTFFWVANRSSAEEKEIKEDFSLLILTVQTKEAEKDSCFAVGSLPFHEIRDFPRMSIGS